MKHYIHSLLYVHASCPCVLSVFHYHGQTRPELRIGLGRGLRIGLGFRVQRPKGCDVRSDLNPRCQPSLRQLLDTARMTALQTRDWSLHAGPRWRSAPLRGMLACLWACKQGSYRCSEGRRAGAKNGLSAGHSHSQRLTLGRHAGKSAKVAKSHGCST